MSSDSLSGGQTTIVLETADQEESAQIKRILKESHVSK